MGFKLIDMGFVLHETPPFRLTSSTLFIAIPKNPVLFETLKRSLSDPYISCFYGGGLGQQPREGGRERKKP